MKAVFISSLLLLSTITSAQLQKGNLLLGGSLGFSQTKNDNAALSNSYSKTFGIDLTPRIGVFVTNRAVIGLDPGYSFNQRKYISPGDSLSRSETKEKTIAYTIRPFYRYYFPIGEKFAFYLHGRAGVSFEKETSKYIDTNSSQAVINQKSTNNSAEISISPGCVFFITQKWSIESMISSLSYQYSKQKEGSEQAKSGILSFQHNVFSFGLSWYMAR